MERTERNRLTDLAAGDAARLNAEGNAPNLMGSGEISSPSKIPQKETYQTKEVCEPVESSGVRGEIMVRDLLIATLTETLPVLSLGTVSTILGENWETGRKHEQPPVIYLLHVTPSLSAAYAVRGSSTFTVTPMQSMQSQTILQREFSPRHLSLNRRPTCSLTNGHQSYCSHTDTQQHN